MYELQSDVQALQQLIDRSILEAGDFLKKSFQMPDHSLSAVELIERLQGNLTVSLATVTSNGEPRVAPINAIFYRAKYYIPTVHSAARTKMIKRNASISLTQYEGDKFAVIIHGTATLIDTEHNYYSDLDKLRTELGLSDISKWGKGNEGVYIRIEPHVLYTYTSG